MPYPPNDGGAIATLNMIRGFSNYGDELMVLSMQTHKHAFLVKNLPIELTEKIKWAQVWVNTKLNPVKALVNLLFSKKPYNAVRFESIVFKEELKSILSTNSFDIIQLEGLYLSSYIKTIRNNSTALISLRAHNIEHEIWERLAINESFYLKRVYLNLISKRIKRMEFGVLDKIDLLVPITGRDAKVLKMHDVFKVKVSPTGIEESKFELAQVKSFKTIFYLGALDWIPNQEAVLWFIKNVWIIIKKEFPKWEFKIAGRNAPLSFERELEKYPVKYIGEVESATQFIDENNIMVVPLLSGSGMRIKIIEGMARGKCILTSPIGAEGIRAENTKEIYIQETAKDFLRVLKNLMQNENQIVDCGKNAFIFVQQNYDNRAIVGELRGFYLKHI